MNTRILVVPIISYRRLTQGLILQWITTIDCEVLTKQDKTAFIQEKYKICIKQIKIATLKKQSSSEWYLKLCDPLDTAANEKYFLDINLSYCKFLFFRLAGHTKNYKMKSCHIVFIALLPISKYSKFKIWQPSVFCIHGYYRPILNSSFFACARFRPS